MEPTTPKWRPLADAAIEAFKAGRFQEGMAAVDRLLSHLDANPELARESSGLIDALIETAAIFHRMKGSETSERILMRAVALKLSMISARPCSSSPP